MKYTEEEYIQEVKLVHKNEFEVISRFKGLTKPILVKDKYGILEIKTARQLLITRPAILSAVNKTEYFMNQLKDKYPEIAIELQPLSEYTTAKTKMLFDTIFGIVSTTPDTLLAGHVPNIRSATDRKKYFYNQLCYLYSDFDYDFIVGSTDRHKGKVTLICPIHGNKEIDSDWIFSGCGCPECNKDWNKSNSLYLIELSKNNEIFYKIGVSYRLKNKELRRYRDYRSLGYTIREILSQDFEDYLNCIDAETKIKRLIKEFLYTPENWEYKTSTECFKGNILEVIIEKVKLYMI